VSATVVSDVEVVKSLDGVANPGKSESRIVRPFNGTLCECSRVFVEEDDAVMYPETGNLVLVRVTGIPDTPSLDTKASEE